MKKLALIMGTLATAALLGAGCSQQQAPAPIPQPVSQAPQPAIPTPEAVTPTPAINTPAPAPNPSASWKTYSNSVFGYSIGYPTTAAVRVIKNVTQPKEILNQIEIDDPAMINGVEPKTIAHVTVWSKNNLMNVEGLQKTEKTVNGNKLTIYYGNKQNDVGGSGSIVDVFLNKNSRVYELDIVGAGSDINDSAVSTYLNSFQVK